jgi:hypothetical protein
MATLLDSRCVHGLLVVILGVLNIMIETALFSR